MRSCRISYPISFEPASERLSTMIRVEHSWLLHRQQGFFVIFADTRTFPSSYHVAPSSAYAHVYRLGQVLRRSPRWENGPTSHFPRRFASVNYFLLRCRCVLRVIPRWNQNLNILRTVWNSDTEIPSHSFLMDTFAVYSWRWEYWMPLSHRMPRFRIISKYTGNY